MTYEEVDRLLLEKLVTSELQGTLEEVTSGGGTETSEESTGTLSGDGLTETTNQALVVLDGVKLDAGLDTERNMSLAVVRRRCSQRRDVGQQDE